MSYLKSKPGSVEEAITAAVMQEKLSPKQQKLDKNNNGKIDGSDLAKLRAKKEDSQIQMIMRRVRFYLNHKTLKTL